MQQLPIRCKEIAVDGAQVQHASSMCISLRDGGLSFFPLSQHNCVLLPIQLERQWLQVTQASSIGGQHSVRKGTSCMLRLYEVWER